MEEDLFVVGLVSNIVNDVLVVVDGVDGRFVDIMEDGEGEVSDVDDVGGGVVVSGRVVSFLFIEFVIEEQVVVVISGSLVLVGVGSIVVGGVGELFGQGMVRDVDDGQGIFVVVEVDFFVVVLGLGIFVDDVLGVVDVVIVGNVVGILGMGGVGDVNYLEIVMVGQRGVGIDGEDGVGFWVGNDVVVVVEVSEEGGQVRVIVGVGVEGDRVGFVDGQKFVEIEDLKIVVGGFGVDVGEVFDDFDVML